MTAYDLVVTETRGPEGNQRVRMIHQERFAADSAVERCARGFIGAHFDKARATTSKSKTASGRTLGISYQDKDQTWVHVEAAITAS